MVFMAVVLKHCATELASDYIGLYQYSYNTQPLNTGGPADLHPKKDNCNLIVLYH